jgi:hypothetical protein
MIRKVSISLISPYQTLKINYHILSQMANLKIIRRKVLFISGFHPNPASSQSTYTNCCIYRIVPPDQGRPLPMGQPGQSKKLAPSRVHINLSHTWTAMRQQRYEGKAEMWSVRTMHTFSCPVFSGTMLQCCVLTCGRSVTAFSTLPRSRRLGQGPRSPHPKAVAYRGGFGGFKPPWNSETEPNSEIRGKLIRDNLMKIRVSLIFKLSGTPD